MKKVVHYKAGIYLPITETWIYGQIINLKDYKPIIYAYQTENLNIYPSENIKIRSMELRGNLKNLWEFFNRGWNKVFKFYPYFAFALMMDKPDLVHSHFGTSGYDFLKLKRIFKLPLITTFYGFDISYLPSQHPEWRERYKGLFEEGELFLVEGNYMKKCLIELGCPEGKIIVQHLGIDLDKIKFMPRKPEGEEIKILISSSFREKKGIPYAVEAFGKVKSKHPELPLKLTIIGDSPGGKPNREKEMILAIIEKYNLKDCIDMLGYQPYPVFIKELYRHHIFLHPSVHASDSDTEGGAPVSIIEASASGMPVLSTTHCDIPEVIKDGVTGYLVPERDSDALAEKLEFLLLNPDLWEKIGIEGRRHIERNYDLKKQAQRLEKIYDNVLK